MTRLARMAPVLVAFYAPTSAATAYAGQSKRPNSQDVKEGK